MRERFERQKQASIRALATLNDQSEFTVEKCVQRAFANYTKDVGEQNARDSFAAGYRCGLNGTWIHNLADGADVLFHAELIVNVMREALYMHQVHPMERFEDSFFDLAGLNLAIKFACLDADEFEAAVTLLCDLKLVRIHNGTLRFVEENDATNEKLKESLASRLTNKNDEPKNERSGDKHAHYPFVGMELIIKTMRTREKEQGLPCTRGELFVATRADITAAEFGWAIEYLLNNRYIKENNGKLCLVEQSDETHV